MRKFKNSEGIIEIHTKYGVAKPNRRGYYYITSGNDNTGKYLHRLMWAEKKGEIPENKIVYFLDGDLSNFDMDNLRLTTRSEFQKMLTASYHWCRGSKLSERHKEAIRVAREGIKRVKRPEIQTLKMKISRYENTSSRGWVLKEYPKKTKYSAQIRIDKKTHYLGEYDTPEEAHEKYLVAKSNILSRLRNELIEMEKTEKANEKFSYLKN